METKTNMNEQTQPSSSSNLEKEHESSIPNLPAVLSGEEFITHMKNKRFNFVGKDKLRVIQKTSEEPVFTVTLSLHSSNDKIEFTIWDYQTSNKYLLVTSALLVPTGNESSPTFTTSESIHQLMESVHADRLIVITRQNSLERNKQIDEETAKSNCTRILRYFLPASGDQEIIIYSPPKEETQSLLVASGTLDSGDSFAIQDVPIKNTRLVSRQLIFTSNLKAIQSEMIFRITGGKRKKKICDHRKLQFEIHKAMAGSFLVCPNLIEDPSIVILGLGGGCLPSFLHQYFTNSSIICVDIDHKMVDIARTYFKLDNSIETQVCDGIEYVKQMVEEKKHADYLFVDIDCKDLSDEASFPPMVFLTKQFIEMLHTIVGETGVVVYNVCSKREAMYTIIKKQFSNVFKNVFTSTTGDVNHVFIISDRTIITDYKQMNESRTEQTKDMLDSYCYPIMKQ